MCRPPGDPGLRACGSGLLGGVLGDDLAENQTLCDRRPGARVAAAEQVVAAPDAPRSGRHRRLAPGSPGIRGGGPGTGVGNRVETAVRHPGLVADAQRSPVVIPGWSRTHRGSRVVIPGLSDKLRRRIGGPRRTLGSCRDSGRRPGLVPGAQAASRVVIPACPGRAEVPSHNPVLSRDPGVHIGGSRRTFGSCRDSVSFRACFGIPGNRPSRHPGLPRGPRQPAESSSPGL